MNRRIRKARERRQYARANWLIEDRRRRMVLAHGADPHRSWTSIGPQHRLRGRELRLPAGFFDDGDGMEKLEAMAHAEAQQWYELPVAPAAPPLSDGFGVPLFVQALADEARERERTASELRAAQSVADRLLAGPRPRLTVPL